MKSSLLSGIAKPAVMVPFSKHVTRMALYGLIALGPTTLLALAVKAPISSPGNISIEVSKPDWYLLWIYSIENFWGLGAVPYVLTPALILILLVPYIDRGEETDPRKRRIMIVLLVLAGNLRRPNECCRDSSPAVAPRPGACHSPEKQSKPDPRTLADPCIAISRETCFGHRLRLH